jgi:hypothetical protein
MVVLSPSIGIFHGLYIPSELLQARISEVTIHIHSQKLYRQEYSESIHYGIQ